MNEWNDWNGPSVARDRMFQREKATAKPSNDAYFANLLRNQDLSQVRPEHRLLQPTDGETENRENPNEVALSRHEGVVSAG